MAAIVLEKRHSRSDRRWMPAVAIPSTSPPTPHSCLLGEIPSSGGHMLILLEPRGLRLGRHRHLWPSAECARLLLRTRTSVFSTSPQRRNLEEGSFPALGRRKKPLLAVQPCTARSRVQRVKHSIPLKRDGKKQAIIRMRSFGLQELHSSGPMREISCCRALWTL